MAAERNSAEPDGTVDPWAPGGEMSSLELRPTGTGAAGAATRTGIEPSGDPPGPRRRRTGRRNRSIIVAMAVVLAMVSAAAWVTNGGDTAPAPPADETSVPQSSGPRSTSPPAGAAASASAPTLSLDVAPPPATPVLDIVTVEPDLAEISPTEVVALSAADGLVEISLPSGRVRTTDLGNFAGTAQLVVNDEAALIWPTASGGETRADGARWQFSVVAPGAPSLPVVAAAASNTGSVLTTPGGDEFIIWPESEDRSSPATVVSRRESSTSGFELDVTSVGFDLDGSGLPQALDPSGALLVENSGGVYRIDADGTTRLSTGDLLSVGRRHVLVRECDEALDCGLVTIDAAGQRRATGVDLDRSDPSGWWPTADGVAPAGDAVLARRPSGVGTGTQLVIVDLMGGDIQVVHGSPTFELDGAWAPDGAGVFFADGDLRYHRRIDSRVTTVSADLGDLRAIATRLPTSTALCDVLAATSDRFAEMRLRSDEIDPPPVEWLDAIIDWSEPDVAAGVDPLARFVEEFVSAQRIESRRIENWPASVRVGVERIDGEARSCRA